ncbi:hypothetical protein HK104_010391 [Borealophlyctis nickersoniae]|nr:hypothetical protein HK104_010391 [Borealophlyctis nickersoniae]
MNGEYADDIRIPKRSNIRVLNRPNTCMDFGAWPIGIKFAEMRRKPYERYILMNASVRGPMMPAWSKSCWSDIFFNRLNRNNVKLVGLTYNCQFKPHVQSMLIALDRVSLQIIEPALKCYQNIEKAIWEGELVLADMIRREGYNVDVVMSAFHGVKNYQENCEGIGPHNPWHTNTYFNRSFHPFETIFHKSNRHVDDHTLAMYTKWAADRKYSSYDYCKRGK